MLKTSYHVELELGHELGHEPGYEPASCQGILREDVYISGVHAPPRADGAAKRTRFVVVIRQSRFWFDLSPVRIGVLVPGIPLTAR